MSSHVKPTLTRLRNSVYVKDPKYGSFYFDNTDVTYNVGNDIKVGVENPSWRVQIARKQDAGTNYSRKFWVVSSAYSRVNTAVSLMPGTTDQRVATSQGSRLAISGESLVYDVDDPALRDQALMRMKRKLNSDIDGFQALVPLVELRELRGLVRNTANLATQMVKDLVNIKKTSTRKALKLASQTWLTFSFGVKPLINDTKAVSESISSYLSRRDHVVSYKALSSKTWKSGGVLGPTTGAYFAPAYYQNEALHELSYKYSGCFDLNIRSANNYGITDHFGLEFGALPSLAWELIPYSWVVDYFANVGEYLEDRFSSDPGTIRYLSLSKRYKMKSKCKIFYLPTGNAKCDFVGRDGFLEYTSLVRSKLGVLPKVGLRLHSADRVGLSAVNKLLNLASILLK